MGRHARFVLLYVLLSLGTLAILSLSEPPLTFTDRDPEQEAEEKVEEEKATGADEAGEAAVETGFANAGGDWETAAPGAFAGAATTGGWDGATGEDWATSGAPGTTEWATEGTKESQW